MTYSALTSDFISFLNQIRLELDDKIFFDSAAPSLVHKNPLIRWFVWQRIYMALNLSKGLCKGNVLDFGSGTGVASIFSCNCAKTYYALDLETTILEKTKDRFGLNNMLIIKYDGEHVDLPSESVDFILSLEVFEHINDLEKTIKELYRLCRKGGFLLFSIPTENTLYKMGRKLSGFKGDYHKNSISFIKDKVKNRFNPVKELNLFTLLPFYYFGVYQKL
jgi:2-polyprenyl-3-methyl-5-hydroxy-6-metoxy-1,4-benzoquinol methylase